MAINRNDLKKVENWPAVAAAIKARDEAAEAAREAYRAYRAVDEELGRRNAQLEEIASEALAAWERGEI